MRISLLAGVLLVGACAAGSGVDDAAAPPATTSTTAPSATPAPPPTLPPATPTTTVPPAPTYTLPPPTVPLPQPIAPPLDDEASEPVVPFGSIAIPTIGIDRPIFEGIRLPTFDLGPGHWPGSAAPGQIGNMVIGGHRTDGNADFADLDQLQPGDEVVVTDTAGAGFRYLVESVEITDPFATRLVHQTQEATATLFACHPPGSTELRVVAHLALAA